MSILAMPQLRIPPLRRRKSGGGVTNFSSGAIGYYKQEEASGVAIDSSGNGRNLTDNNTVTSNPGKVLNARQYTALNSESHSSTDTAFDLNTNDFTIAAFVYPDEVATGDATTGRGAISNHNGDVAGDYMIGLRPNMSVACAHWKSGGADLTGLHITNNTGLVTVAAWHSIIFRRTGGVYTIRVDGVDQAFTDTSTLSGWGTTDFRIGSAWSGGGTSYFMDGRIDIVVIAARSWSLAECIQYEAGAQPS